MDQANFFFNISNSKLCLPMYVTSLPTHCLSGLFSLSMDNKDSFHSVTHVGYNPE